MKNGVFVAVEGIDGAGKDTQVDLLYQRARQAGLRVAQIRFPRDGTSTGEEVRKYLDGAYGNIREVDPRFASTLFMIDRRDAQRWIEQTLRKTDLLIANRYSAANMAYQAAKFSGREREAMEEWLQRFEHEDPLHHRRPDHILFFDLPADVAQKARAEREATTGNRPDIHESEEAYQEAVREVYLDLARQDPQRWSVMNCLRPDSSRYPPEELSNQVWDIVRQAGVTKTSPQIYFAAPIRGTFVARKEVQRIGEVLRSYGNILDEHVLRDDVLEWEAEQTARGVNTYERDEAWLNHANILVAEVTSPGSYGVGMEIRQATAELGIPVIAFYNPLTLELSGREMTRMITDNKGVTLVPYTPDNLEEAVHRAMKSVMGILI